MLSERLKASRDAPAAAGRGEADSRSSGGGGGESLAGSAGARAGYVYLAINAEPGGGQACVKVGRTKSPRRRVTEYRRVSPETEFLRVAGPYGNCHEVEKLLIGLFRETHGSPVRGREYFAVSGGAGYQREVALFTRFCHDEVGRALGIPVPMEVD
jgi:hypothetical protein